MASNDSEQEQHSFLYILLQSLACTENAAISQAFLVCPGYGVNEI